MHAKPGDRIEVDSAQVGTTPRQGEVLEVLDADRTEHYRIRWSDGHESLYFPSSDARIVGQRRAPNRR